MYELTKLKVGVGDSERDDYRLFSKTNNSVLNSLIRTFSWDFIFKYILIESNLRALINSPFEHDFNLLNNLTAEKVFKSTKGFTQHTRQKLVDEQDVQRLSFNFDYSEAELSGPAEPCYVIIFSYESTKLNRVIFDIDENKEVYVRINGEMIRIYRDESDEFIIAKEKSMPVYIGRRFTDWSQFNGFRACVVQSPTKKFPSSKNQIKDRNAWLLDHCPARCPWMSILEPFEILNSTMKFTGNKTVLYLLQNNASFACADLEWDSSRNGQQGNIFEVSILVYEFNSDQPFRTYFAAGNGSQCTPVLKKLCSLSEEMPVLFDDVGNDLLNLNANGYFPKVFHNLVEPYGLVNAQQCIVKKQSNKKSKYKSQMDVWLLFRQVMWLYNTFHVDTELGLKYSKEFLTLNKWSKEDFRQSKNRHKD
jgi:hypothetical protein